LAQQDPFDMPHFVGIRRELLGYAGRTTRKKEKTTLVGIAPCRRKGVAVQTATALADEQRT